MSDDQKNYTSTEVGTMIENLESKFQAVIDVVAPLPERLSAVENRLSKVENRLVHVEDAIRVAIPSIYHRLDKIETKIGI